MPKKITKSLLIPLSFGIAAFLLVFIGITFILSLHRLQDSSRKVEHTYQVIGSLQSTLLYLGGIERGLRGYLLTRNRDLLITYHFGISHVYKELENGRNLTSDNGERQDSFASLQPLVDQKIRWNQQILGLCQNGKFNDAVRIFQTGGGKKIMDQIESKISGMEHMEFNLLADRKEQETESSRHVTRVILVSGLLTIFFCTLAAFLLIRQVQERSRFIKLILKNEQLLFQFLEAIPVGIFVLDSAGKPYYANQAAKELFGKGIDHDTGLEQLPATYQVYLAQTDQLYPPSQMPLVRAMFGEKNQRDDLEIHRGGKIIPIQLWGTPVFDERNKVKYAIAAFIDITERKEIEEMKNDLISIVSHQLKTPVAEINGYLENLLEGLAGELSQKQREYLSDMRDIGQDNYRLISDLLSLSKIERGVLVAELRSVPLSQVILLSVRDYETRIKEKGLQFAIEGMSPEIYVRADLDKTVETVRNLINNALKCTDKGGISVHLRNEGLFGIIEVRDTGIGMTEEGLSRLFTKSRVMGKESHRSGAGIGLYIAKHFMQLQDSFISATSKAGQGTCFTIKIPVSGLEKKI